MVYINRVMYIDCSLNLNRQELLVKLGWKKNVGFTDQKPL